MSQNMLTGLKVERETYEKNGKTFYSYFIKGVIRGKTVKATVIPPDVGGYVVLDIVFDANLDVNLVITPFEMKDSNTGGIITGTTYSVVSTDENGVVYECKVKPSRPSDKALLNMMLR